MANSPSDDEALRRKANELYWTSDESVNQIADDLDLSKGSLYNLVEPRPAGLPCPRCSTEMEYPNRTARDKGFLTCPACDLEEDEELVRAEWKSAARRSESGTMVVSPGSGTTARGGGSGEEAGSSRVALGTALLGAAAGLALVMWVRKGS